MNILYIVQQSVYTKNRKWTSADSNIQMMRGMINEVLKRSVDIRFYVLISPLYDFEDITNYTQLIDHDRVTFIPYATPVDAFLNRQNFNTIQFTQCMRDLPSIDIIWNNITELSRNIKTWLVYNKYDAKLITSCYWLDCPLIGEEKVPFEISYMWRQFDGFLCSDLVTFTCESTKEAFIENASRAFDNDFIVQILSKAVIFDFGFSAFELDGIQMESNKERFPIILFLNRLSEINYTHHLEFIKALKILYKSRQNFRVAFTNPSKKISPDYLQQEVPNYLNFLGKDSSVYTRNEYARLLTLGSISVHLFETERYGGCAHREAIHCYNIPLTLKIHEYERIQGPYYPFYLKNLKSQTIADSLDSALSNLQFVQTPEFDNIRQRNLESSYEYQSEKIIETLRSLL